LSDPTGTNVFLFQKFLSPLISPKNFLSLLLSALSFLCSLFSLCSLHLTTAHKTATPRPRLEGDPTPLATPRRRDHPSLPRWLAVEIPAGLEVTHGQACCGGLPCPIPAGLEVTHGQACRGGLPCPILAGLEVTHGQACRLGSPSLPPGLLKFFWVWLLCLVAVMRN
jgi:hypothetical protein